MRKGIKNLLRIGIPLMLVVGVVAGAALPVFAADKSTAGQPESKPGFPPNYTRGEVTAIASDKTSFTVNTGTAIPQVIKVDANTKYFVIPGDLEQAREKAQDKLKDLKDKANQAKERVQEKLKNLPNERGLGNKGNAPSTPPGLQNKAPAQPPVDTDEVFLGQVRKTGRTAAFTDITIGDRVVVKTMPNENLAKFVVIYKKHAVNRAAGTITALGAGTISITPTGGQALNLKWDKDTRFTIEGAVAVQVGQTATVVYNTETMLARSVMVKSA
jgi:hypothetical protein